MPGSAGERRNLGSPPSASLVHAHMVGAWSGRGTGPAAARAAGASEHTPRAWDAARRVDLFFANGPSARAWVARIGLDDGRLRDGRSSVEGLSAAALPGLPSPRLTFAGRLRGDKAPDVLIEALALIDAPPPAYLAGDGPLRGALTRLIRARGLEAVVHLCRDGPMSRPATSHRPPCTSSPHARSRGRKAPCWPWARRPGRRHRGRRPGAHPGRGPRRPGPARGPPRPRRGAVRVLADERPDPALSRACARQFTPSAAAAVYASAFWCRS